MTQPPNDRVATTPAIVRARPASQSADGVPGGGSAAEATRHPIIWMMATAIPLDAYEGRLVECVQLDDRSGSFHLIRRREASNLGCSPLRTTRRADAPEPGAGGYPAHRLRRAARPLGLACRREPRRMASCRAGPPSRHLGARARCQPSPRVRVPAINGCALKTSSGQDRAACSGSRERRTQQGCFGFRAAVGDESVGACRAASPLSYRSSRKRRYFRDAARLLWVSEFTPCRSCFLYPRITA